MRIREGRETVSHTVSFGRKSKGTAKREDSDFGSFVHRIKVSVRLSFNNNGLCNFDFGFNMVLVEIGDLGVRFWSMIFGWKRCKEHCNSVRMHSGCRQYLITLL